jgi:hypothetical protein
VDMPLLISGKVISFLITPNYSGNKKLYNRHFFSNANEILSRALPLIFRILIFEQVGVADIELLRIARKSATHIDCDCRVKTTTRPPNVPVRIIRI